MIPTETGRESLRAALPRRVVVGANGAYWRDFGTHYSMCPVSDDNDPVEPVETFIRKPLVTFFDVIGDPVIAKTFLEVSGELGLALNKFPSFNSPHEGYAVIREELERELWTHVCENTGHTKEARDEAIQIAAMAIRYCLDLTTTRVPT